MGAILWGFKSPSAHSFLPLLGAPLSGRLYRFLCTFNLRHEAEHETMPPQLYGAGAGRARFIIMLSSGRGCARMSRGLL